MPEKVDKQVQAIIDSCVKKGDKTKKECEDMAWAVVNSQKTRDDFIEILDLAQEVIDSNKKIKQ